MTERLAFKANVTTEGRSIRGSVTLAGQRTRRGGEWLEIDPAAIVRADASAVVGRWEHDPHKILGRPGNGTLQLSRTDQGIEYVLTDLPNVSYANDALELVNGGYVTGSSFEIEGPYRYAFSTDPDTGERVRRITHIGRLTDVSPVGDPAFAASTAQAFSKEFDVTDIIEEPVAAPKPEAPAVQFAAPKDDKSETYRTAEAFARNRDTADLEQAMENLIAGGLDSAARQETYAAFASVYDSRKGADSEARERAERIALAHQLRTGKGPKAPTQAGAVESEDYLQAFGQYLRTGQQRLMEQFAQSISGDGTQGGFTVPDGFLNRLTQRIKAYGGIAGVADEITTSTGESLRWPYLDDTSNTAAIASEGSAVASGGADMVFDSIELGAFEYDATGTGNNPLKISLALLQDSAFDLEGRIAALLGERIGRKQAVHLATGVGGSEPVGLLSKTADTMTATVASLAAPEHIFQVDAAYRDGGNCRFVMSDTTLVKFWQAQSTTNEPLFIPGGSSIGGAPHGTIYGFPVTIDPAAGNLVAFGDMRRGYIVRRVRAVQLLVDPYTAQSARQVAYHAWARMDANIQDPNAYSVSTYASVSADT